MEVEPVKHRVEFCTASPDESPALQISPLVGDTGEDLRGYLSLGQEGEEAGGPDEDAAGERGEIVPLRPPAAPTHAEVEEHEVSGHAKLQDLVQSMHCKSRRSDAHAGAVRDEHALPTVEKDSACLGEAEGDDAESVQSSC